MQKVSLPSLWKRHLLISGKDTSLSLAKTSLYLWQRHLLTCIFAVPCQARKRANCPYRISSGPKGAGRSNVSVVTLPKESVSVISTGASAVEAFTRAR